MRNRAEYHNGVCIYLWALTCMRGSMAVELASYVALLASKQARPLETRAHALNFEYWRIQIQLVVPLKCEQIKNRLF